MPTYRPPYSDRERLAFLKRAAATGPQDIAAGNAYLSQDTLDDIAALLPSFEAAANAVSVKLSARAKETRERAEAIAQVELCTRDLWNVLKRRVRRKNQPAEVLTFYGLPLDGTVPGLRKQEEWLTVAAQVVQGDADAVAAGHEAMVNPSAAELQAVLDAARSEADDVAAADRAYDEAQEALAALSAQASELIDEVMAQLRFHLRKKDAPSQRRVIRSYGARYDYLSGEPVEPGEEFPGGEEEPQPEL